MGVAVLEGDELLYYAVKELRRMRPAYQLLRAARDVVTDLIERYQPDIVAYEEIFYVQQTASRLLQSEQREIRRVGLSAKLRVFGYSPLYVRQTLCGDPYATKQMVADLLIRRFPELAGYRHGHSWRSERYWLNMFDALAIAVVAGRESERSSETSAAERDARAA